MKKITHYLPSHFLVFIIIGICLQFYMKIWRFSSSDIVIVILCLLLTLSITFLLKLRIVFTINSWFLFLFLGISSVFISNDKNYQNHYSKLQLNNANFVLKVNKVLKSNNYYDKYESSIIQIDSIKTKGMVLLSISKDSLKSKLLVGQKILAGASLKNISPNLNPYGFDYQKYLAKKGIEHQISLNSNEYYLINDASSSIKTKIVSLRTKIQSLLQDKNFEKKELDVVNALLLGQRQEVSNDLLDDYVKAGAIHILAISGLHIGIVLLILSKIFHPLERLKNGNYIKIVLIVITLWLFALFTGLSASVVRATTMFTFIAIGNLLHKNSVIEYSLITSMLVILLVKPMFIFDVGFQLSYLAVFGIIWVQPLLYTIWKPKFKLVDKTWQLITVSIGAQVGVLPIGLYYFHQFPGLFILSNIIIVPLLGIILFVGFLVIILTLLNSLPNVMVTIYSFCIAGINKFIHWVSLQEQFIFNNISMSLLKMISFYVLIICCFQFIINKIARKLIFALSSIILVQGIYMYEKQYQLHKNELVIFHKNKNSILGMKKGEQLAVFHDLDSLALKKDKIIPSYLVGNNIKKSSYYKKKHLYKFKNRSVLYIDSLGIYSVKGLKNPIIVLQNSPKINLERLIESIEPYEVIADGSNYKSLIKQWQKTCIKQKTPFYDTRKNGAYIIIE